MPDGAAVVRYQGRHGASWRIKFKDATGRQVMQTLGREAEGWTEQKAERELGKRLPLVHRERWRQPDEITFETFADRFMNEYLPGRNLKPTTIAGYRSSLDNHLLPALGHLPLQDLEARPDLVDTYISEKTGEGLSPKTITNHLLLLNVMLRRAVAWRLIRTNPVAAVDRPRVKTPEMNILTNVESTRLTTAYDQLTEVADNNDDRSRWALAKTITLVALGTALRRGELLALRWRDIELLEKRLHVREALVRGEITTPKSRASRRTITLGPRTTAVLADWWQQTPVQG